MRLIDGKELADEILGKIFERGQASGLWEQQLEIGAITYRDIEFADGYDKALDDVYRKINDIPTVEAIPIEWILNYRKNNQGEITYYTIDAIDHMLCEWCKRNNIDMWDMIDSWEKENEID